MALYADRVKQSLGVTGTGTITLTLATTGNGYQSFLTAFGTGTQTVAYCIADQTGPNWEVGTGTYNGSANTLARTTVLASSNGGLLTNFSGGTQDVFCTAPAAYLLPAGSNTQVQFNNAGAFGASSNFTYNTGTNTLTTGNIIGSELAMTIQTRAPTASEAAGGLNLFTPNAARANGTAGQVSLLGGNGLGTGGGGGASLRGGDGGTNGSGGGVILRGGSGFGTGNGGGFSAVAASAQSSGNGGSCSFTSGGSIGSGNAGNITFTAGAATNGNGGSITFVTQFSGGAGVPRIKMDMGGGSDGDNVVAGEFEVYSSLSGTTIFQCSVDVVSYTGTIGFFGVTPVTQPTTATTEAVFDVNSGGTIHPTSTFDGYTLAQVVRALRDLGILA